VPSNQIAVYPAQSSRLTAPFGVAVREDVAFTNHKGEEKSGVRKNAEKLLEKLQEPLRKFLEPDEAVFCIVRAQVMPSGVEQFFLGWHAMFLMPGALVLTNRRLIHVLVDRNGGWKRILRCARWGDIAEAKAKGLLGARLTLKYRDGKKETFSQITGGDAKRIQLLLEAFLPAAAGETSPAQSITSLCPDCKALLNGGVYECPQCHRAFKDENTAVKRTWLIPGGGFFYTGHPFLGILHGIVEGILLIVVLYWLLIGLGVVAPDSGSEGAGDKASALIVLAVFAGVFAIHKWVQASVARKQVRNFLPLS